ncbi:F-box/LRR-repeat protein [Trifolium repens]|nr:F-box/LRR-repeat protein [Trifolium repens]
MEQLPVEVIGKILSHLSAARDVVIASATCRTWRIACCKHLHTLSFSCNDWRTYGNLRTTRLESLITQTIFQTSGLQALTILIYDVGRFSPSTVMAWLMHTRETLRQLFYNVRTMHDVNILQIRGGMHKLEILYLAHNSIVGVEPNNHRFPCLKSLSLSYVCISALDLNLLVSACPKIEALELVNPKIAISDSPATIEVSSPTLKSVYIVGISCDKFVLDADGIESLHLRSCVIEVFKLIGRGTLKHLTIEIVSIIHLDIGDTIEDIESVDTSYSTTIWPKFYHMISRSPNLKKLRLWEGDNVEEIVDLKLIATCNPHLSHLCLSYDVKYGVVDCAFYLENVTVLELGWSVLDDVFSHWVEGLIKLCPKLKKLVIHGDVSHGKSVEECKMLANFTLSIVKLMRRYRHIDPYFNFEKDDDAF